jgi:hypothetical protein
MSWTALSIIHNAICEICDPYRCYRLKGDDLIALWTQQQITLYKGIAARCGLITNEKTWQCKSIGTFCEGDYVLSWGSRGTVATLTRLPTISLRSFVKDEPVPIEIADRFVARGFPSGVFTDMQSYFHSKWKKLCREKAVNPYGPRAFGGLGLYGPDRRLDSLTAKIVNASHNGCIITNADPVKHKGFAGKCQALYDGIKWSVNGSVEPEDLKVVYTRALALCSFMDALGNRGRKTVRHTPGKVVRALAAYRRRFLRSGAVCVAFPTTVKAAYDVLKRLKPHELRCPEGFELEQLSAAPAEWFTVGQGPIVVDE